MQNTNEKKRHFPIVRGRRPAPLWCARPDETASKKKKKARRIGEKIGDNILLGLKGTDGDGNNNSARISAIWLAMEFWNTPFF